VGLSAGPKPEEIVSDQAIRRVLQQRRGSDLIVLGHVENSSFVVRNASGGATFVLPLARLREMAKEENVQLIEIGCNTSSVNSGADTATISVATRFNTVEAMTMLGKALSKATDYASFFAAFASEGLLVVADAKAYEPHDTVTAKVYAQAKDALESDQQVGEISVTSKKAWRLAMG
jgi:hypothetical protein